jgi:hypothetical protein
MYLYSQLLALGGGNIMSTFFITMGVAADGGFQPVKAVKLPNSRIAVVNRSPITTHCPELAEEIAEAWAKEEGLIYNKKENDYV